MAFPPNFRGRSLIRSAKEAAVWVSIDHPQGLGEGRGLRAGLVAEPAATGSFPKNAPHALMGHALDLGDAFLYPLAGALEGRADEKELDGAVLNALPLAHLVAQMQRRTASGPKAFLQHFEVLREFVVSEGHERLGRSVGSQVRHEGGEEVGGGGAGGGELRFQRVHQGHQLLHFGRSPALFGERRIMGFSRNALTSKLDRSDEGGR